MIHLRPTAPLAERVLLPGDPGRALTLAQTLLEKPLMFNHHRGLWGYTGAARADGEPLTIQATGMGGPSAAIVLTELISLGARRLIRVGTCGALAPDLALGDLVIARESVCLDGASRVLLAADRVLADPELTEALEQAGRAYVSPSTRRVHVGPIVSVDLFSHDRIPLLAGPGRARDRDGGRLAVRGRICRVGTRGLLACRLRTTSTPSAPVLGSTTIPCSPPA